MDEQGSQSRTRVIWVTIVASVVAAIGLVVMLLLGSSDSDQNHTIPLSQLAHQVQNGEIQSLEVSDDRVLAVTTTGQRFTTLLGHTNLFDARRQLGVVHRDVLVRVAQALLEHGTLHGDELESLFQR